MGSVSIYVSPVPHKEFSKKKRTSKVAKLKQCKLVVRCEQWLSQVKGNEIQPAMNDNGRSSPTLFIPDEDEVTPLSIHGENLNYLLSNTNTGEPCSPHQLTSSGSSSNSSCWSISFSEDDDDCLDDWETIADALTISTPDKPKFTQNPQPKNTIASPVTQMASNTTEVKQPKPLPTRQAWSANDTLRPQSLPNLSNKISIPTYSKMDTSHQSSSQPTCCPICCEDLDVTDSSFQPCTCGFLLCLFCYKTIAETDSRCPSCRQHYIC